jgi:hypothetical protein
MLLAAMSGASLLYFARSLNEPSTKNLFWWGSFSAVALLIHFFAIFLLGAEAVWLLYRVRRPTVLIGAAPLLATCAVLAPLGLAHASSSSVVGFISNIPLRTRIEQTPVAFALGTLSKSSLVSQGLLGAAVVTGVVIVLLVIGASDRELRGAGVAALMAACALVAPLLLALVGHDFFLDRALIPAWIPLAVVVGAACTARRTLVPGMVFGAIVLAGFVYAQVRIDRNPRYQRTDWRGVAHALGTASSSRAIVAYNGDLAVLPLSYYLPRARWDIAPTTVLSVGEVDVVASIYQPALRSLPAGTKLVAHTSVANYVVDRFRLTPPWRLTTTEIAARADQLAPPAAPDSRVVIQAPAKP